MPVSFFHKSSLTKRYFCASLLIIIPLAFALGAVLSSSLEETMLERARTATSKLVTQEVLHELTPNDLHIPKKPAVHAVLSQKINHLSLGGDVVQVKVWSKNKEIIWSKNPEDAGKKIIDNRNLDEALTGKTSVSFATPSTLKAKYGKQTSISRVMEIYVPVRFPDHADNKLFVFEVYQDMRTLDKTISLHTRALWFAVSISMGCVFVLLFLIVHRGSRQIHKQQQDLALTINRLQDERTKGDSILASIDDPLTIIDREFTILFQNTSHKEFFGDHTGEKCHTALKKNGVTCEGCPVEDTFADGLSHKRERKIQINGETFYFETMSSPLRDAQGTVISCIEVLHNVTGRKKLEQEIAKERDQWQETFDTINDAITIHDNDFNIIRFNQAARELLGATAEKILSLKCFSLYHGKKCQPAGCPSCEVLKNGISSTTELFEPHLERFLEIKALPRVNANKEIIGVVHIVRDITIRKQVEKEKEKLHEQVIQAQKMDAIGRLASGIAHDFNNILTVINGTAELAIKGIDTKGQLKEDLEAILDAGHRAADLTRKILAFSKKQVMEMQPVQLSSLVQDMAKLLKRIIGENITITLHTDTSKAFVTADSGQMEQIIMNLAINARDAMQAGGTLTIETTNVELDHSFKATHLQVQPGDYCMLAVTDTGHGMSQQTRQHIFEPFFSTKGSKGTGLGLATVYGIVKQHKGYIFVYSEEGKGTTFKIYLPVQQETFTPVSAYEKISFVATAQPPKQATILVVDDDETIRTLIKKALKPLGLDLHFAASAEDALKLYQSMDRPIDLLLTDIILTKMNGKELAETLSRKNPALKVLYVSGYTDNIIADQGMINPGFSFLPKPLSPARLAVKVTEMLAKK